MTDKEKALSAVQTASFEETNAWTDGASNWRKGTVEVTVWAKTDVTIQCKHSDLPALLSPSGISLEEAVERMEDGLREGLREALWLHTLLSETEREAILHDVLARLSKEKEAPKE